MRISDRIIAITQAVAPGETAADIGTDHGYVPFLLYRDGVSPRVIMSDISEDSLSKAKETFNHAGIVLPPDSFRVGDGLQPVSSGEVDDIIIAGLGANTIMSILSENLPKTRSFGRIILQPRNNAGELRYFLYVNGFDIQKEILAGEGKFTCEVIVCRPAKVEHRRTAVPHGDIRWKYPKSFVACDTGLLRNRITWKTDSLREQIERMTESRHDHAERILELQKDMDYLTKLMNENEEFHRIKNNTLY